MDLGALTVAVGRRIQGGCHWCGDGSTPEFALTFDDGPDPSYTPALLDALDRLGAPATFFLLGDGLDAAPAVVDRLAASRHQIGLHGERHRSPFRDRTAAVVDSYRRLRDRLADRTGRDPSALCDVRPPYGLIRPGQVRGLEGAGFRVVLCDVLPGDWSSPADVVVRRALARAGPGSIVALHDGEPHAGPSVASTAAAIIEGLAARGLRATTVRDLPGLRLRAAR